MSRNSLPRLPDHIAPLTDADGEVRELTAEDLKHFRPMRDAMPDAAAGFERARGQRGPQKSPVKERIGLRLDSTIIEHFRATGPGWQSRINDILLKHVESDR